MTFKRWQYTRRQLRGAWIADVQGTVQSRSG